MASLKAPGRKLTASVQDEVASDDLPQANPRETPGSYVLNADGTFTPFVEDVAAPAADLGLAADQDPAETPGSYVAQEDGSFIPDAALTVVGEGPSEAAPAPVLPTESAAAISDALGSLGQDLPAAVTVALAPPEPEAAASPEPDALPASEPETAQSADQDPALPIDQPSALPSGDPA